MASRDKTRARINNAYFVLERLCHSHGGRALELFNEATRRALEGEKAHRRMGRGLSKGYAQSAETAAHYFVVSKYASATEYYPRGSSDDSGHALHYASLRRDILCCMGLRELVPMPVKGFDGLTDLDYSSDIVGDG